MLSKYTLLIGIKDDKKTKKNYIKYMYCNLYLKKMQKNILQMFGEKLDGVVNSSFHCMLNIILFLCTSFK